jgi:hypothetical protein
MTVAQLQDLAASVGFPPDVVPTAAAIAKAESGGYPDAYNTEGSWGLWQVNLPNHPEYAGDPSALYDPTTNARAALKISRGGTDFSPWTTYRCPCTITPCVGTPCYVQYLQPYPGASFAGRHPVLTTIAKVLVIGAAGAAAFFGAPHAVRAAENVL